MKLEAKSVQKISTDSATMTNASPCDLNTAIARTFGSQFFHKTEVIQPLWSGYGEIARYSSDSLTDSRVVKVVRPNVTKHHPRGWNTSRSHQRKLSSFTNERYFYQYYAALTDNLCRLPKYLASGTDGENSWVIMEDLNRAGFTLCYEQADLDRVRLGLRWLAHFHARFLQQSVKKVWAVGTYWHLHTRPDEWHKMPNGQLKAEAHTIDKKLNQASFQTLIHGDAKLANFCFSSEQNDLAAVDFQYVGKGVGIKDVIYFLGSCLNQNQLSRYSESLVDEYFVRLTHAISEYQSDIDCQALEREWRELYVFAWADFERFLLGWMPGHHKLNEYSKEQTEVALSRL